MKRFALFAFLLCAVPCFAQQSSSKVTFTVNNPVPTIVGVSPNTAVAGVGATAITITGTNFNSSTTVTFGSTALTISSFTGTTLATTIPTSQLATNGSFTITVANPAPGGGTATSAFTVSLPPTPVPTIQLVSPASVLVGASDLTITFTGTNYQSNIEAFFQNGSNPAVALTTTFSSATSVSAVIPAAQLVNAGTFSLYLTNPGGVIAHTATITFMASTTPNAQTQVWRGNVTGGPYANLTTTPLAAGITNYVDSTVMAGSTYFYVASAILNGIQSIFSNEVSVTIPTP